MRTPGHRARAGNGSDGEARELSALLATERARAAACRAAPSRCLTSILACFCAIAAKTCSSTIFCALVHFLCFSLPQAIDASRTSAQHRSMQRRLTRLIRIIKNGENENESTHMLCCTRPLGGFFTSLAVDFAPDLLPCPAPCEWAGDAAS